MNALKIIALILLIFGMFAMLLAMSMTRLLLPHYSIVGLLGLIIIVAGFLFVWVLFYWK
jgi:hypothetical protein